VRLRLRSRRGDLLLLRLALLSLLRPRLLSRSLPRLLLLLTLRLRRLPPCLSRLSRS
jgi:hypothetical protein